MDKRIKELRKALKLTLDKFGRQIGVSDATVNSWEHGRNGVSESARRQICAVFNVNREWLETGAGEMFVDGKTQDDLDVEAFRRVAIQFYKAAPTRLKKAAVELARDVIAAAGE